MGPQKRPGKSLELYRSGRKGLIVKEGTSDNMAVEVYLGLIVLLCLGLTLYVAQSVILMTIPPQMRGLQTEVTQPDVCVRARVCTCAHVLVHVFWIQPGASYPAAKNN